MTHDNSLGDRESGQPHFSSAADKNKDYILNALQTLLTSGAHVLEIASGTAQHAIHFASNMPDRVWQPSDRDLDEYGLADTLSRVSLPNLKPPVQIDVTDWPDGLPLFDAVYSANCIHVMPELNLAPYIIGAARHLKPNGLMLFYGPFKFGGAFTTPSNEAFDGFLREKYPGGGIRDFEVIDHLAKSQGMMHAQTVNMPSNNHILVFQKAKKP